ncbi:Ferredoxin--NADP reductase [Cohnella sp. JJ-181]|nr:Ferredoxin--NADP reductase [Cohnella sp. JJ-181]
MPQLGGQLTALYSEKNIYDVAGFPKVKAQELVDHLKNQMELFRTDVRLEEKVLAVRKLGERSFEIVTDGAIHQAKAIIIAAGIGAFEPRRLELPEAIRFENSNLHYFVSDLERFRGKKVLISGGGDSALDRSLMLEPIAERVTLVHRRDKFRAHEHSVELLTLSKVNVVVPTENTALHGEESIEWVVLTDVKTQTKMLVDVDEVIINFGFVNSLGPIRNWGLVVGGGSLVVDTKMVTNIPGIFAAGDISIYPGKLKPFTVGFGEAPTAINNANVYIDTQAKLSPGQSSNMKM